MSSNFSDIDPLDTRDISEEEILNSFYKSTVKGIVGSYVDPFDVFNEVIQNSLDAIDLRYQEDENFQPKLWVAIDLKDNHLTVIDNGIGLLEEEFKKFLTPSMSINKERGKTRGNKGVGATYLAYGFSRFEAQTKRSGQEIAFNFNSARGWVESTTTNTSRPKTQEIPFACPELSNEESGTSIRVYFKGNDKEVPRDLSWLTLETPDEWYRALRLKTPIGYIEIDQKKENLPEVEIIIRDKNSNITKKRFDDPEYFYLWDLEADDGSKVFKSIDIDDIDKKREELIKSSGSYVAKNLPIKFKNNDCMYKIWTSKDMLDPNGFFKTIVSEPEMSDLIKTHNISVFFTMFWSTSAWSVVNEEVIGLRKGHRLIKGGLQLATDWMATGRQITIPLTRNVQYGEQAHVIVHFRDGQPDLGRKTFSSELEELAKLVSAQCVYNFYNRGYKENMRPTSGSKILNASQNLFQDQKKAQDNLSNNPLKLPNQFSAVAQPTDEQDVVALFNQLLRPAYIEGYKILTTSQYDTYDCLFCVDFQNSHVYDEETNILGVTQSQTERPDLSEQQPQVLEYKYNLDGLVEDFRTDEKVESEVDLAVCWELGNKISDEYAIRSLLTGEGADRKYYGSTHVAYSLTSQLKLFEIMCLKDIVLYYRNKKKDLIKSHEETFSD